MTVSRQLPLVSGFWSQTTVRHTAKSRRLVFWRPWQDPAGVCMQVQRLSLVQCQCLCQTRSFSRLRFIETCADGDSAVPPLFFLEGSNFPNYWAPVEHQRAHRRSTNCVSFEGGSCGPKFTDGCSFSTLSSAPAKLRMFQAAWPHSTTWCRTPE